MPIDTDLAVGEVKSYEDVKSVLLSVEHQTGQSHYWWQIKRSERILYGKFDVRSPSRELQERVILFASQCLTQAAEVVSDQISSIEWVDPMKPPFTTPATLGLVSIERDELKVVTILSPTVHIVEYQGTRYIHKFMGYLSVTSSFECEIAHHQRVFGSQFVPKLFYIVTFRGRNRGLLLEFVDGNDLSSIAASQTQSQLYLITAKILEALEDLEKRAYYPQDLKCANIVVRNTDNAIFIVDLGGGFSEGMYLRTALRTFKNGEGSILPSEMLYTLGRTVWELWIDDVPPEDEKAKAPNTLLPLIRSLVDECCGGIQFESVTEVKEHYHDRLLAAGADGVHKIERILQQDMNQ